MNTSAGYPRQKAGHPPSNENPATPLSNSGDDGRDTPQKHGSKRVDTLTAEKIAFHELNCLNGPPAEIIQNIEAGSALVGRTWKKEKEPNRDEKRLMKRYKRINDDHISSLKPSWEACPRCQQREHRN